MLMSLAQSTAFRCSDFRNSFSFNNTWVFIEKLWNASSNIFVASSRNFLFFSEYPRSQRNDMVKYLEEVTAMSTPLIGQFMDHGALVILQ